MTVVGVNFGPATAGAVVTVGGIPCERTDWRSHSSLQCVVPRGLGANHVVAVWVPSTLPARESKYSQNDIIIFLNFINTHKLPHTLYSICVCVRFLLTLSGGDLKLKVKSMETTKQPRHRNDRTLLRQSVESNVAPAPRFT